jgi:hypothetical protein
MSDDVCAGGCGAPRYIVVNGVREINVEPTSGLCINCLPKANRTFHSRRDDRAGEVVDTKALAARNDE